MAQSRLTINLKCHKVDDWGATRQFLRDLDPVEVVAAIDNLNDFNRILEIQHDLPNAKVHARPIIQVNGVEYDGAMHLTPLAPGDDRHYLISPGDFLNMFGDMGRGGLSLYCLNEPSGEVDQQTIAQLVQWIIECIGLANQRGIALTILNFGVGHPRLINNESEWDARFDDVLELLSKYRQHTLGIHLYAPADTFGRLDAMIARCKRINGGIRPPSTAITEFGYDTHGGSKQNGYRTRGLTGEQYAAWQLDHVRNVYSPYIRAGVVTSIATFIWGDNASWAAFNVENDGGWRDAILTAKREGKLTFNAQATTPITPNYTPVEFVAGKQYKIEAGAVRNLREQPSTGTTKIVGSVVGGDVVTALEQKIVGSDYWWKITITRVSIVTDTTVTTTGWLSHDGASVKFVREPEPVDNPPPVGLPPAFLEVTAEYAMRMHVSTLKIVENVRKEAAGVLGSNVSIDAEIEALKAKKASNVLRAQDLETGAQMYKEIADNWKWIAEQTTPPVAA